MFSIKQSRTARGREGERRVFRVNKKRGESVLEASSTLHFLDGIEDSLVLLLAVNDSVDDELLGV